MTKTKLIITCEHASNKIPPSFKPYFARKAALLQTHRGWDIGAHAIYRYLTKRLDCWQNHGQWSRLLIDLNRSLTHPNCFSDIIKSLPITLKNDIIHQYYRPYHEAFNTTVASILAQRARIIHISVHSFTPVLNRVRRNADIGLLYDPQSPQEAQFARRWLNAFNDVEPGLRVKRNYPYRGTSVGLTSITRKRLHYSKNYIGIELEVNQALLQDKVSLQRLCKCVYSSLEKILCE